MSRRIEFVVATDGIRWDGRWLVVGGRCLDGPVFLGDVFREVRVGEQSQPAALEVVEIRGYGRLFFELYPVMTAELLLKGVGGGPVVNPSTLIGDEEDR